MFSFVVMYERILAKLGELTLTSRYVLTSHAYDEMVDDEFSIWDVESAILSGQIAERQRDATTGESKYRVSGPSLAHRDMSVVVKMVQRGKWWS